MFDRRCSDTRRGAMAVAVDRGGAAPRSGHRSLRIAVIANPDIGSIALLRSAIAVIKKMRTERASDEGRRGWRGDSGKEIPREEEEKCGSLYLIEGTCTQTLSDWMDLVSL